VAARTSETLVNFYQTTRRYNPEDSQPNTKNFRKKEKETEEKRMKEEIRLNCNRTEFLSQFGLAYPQRAIQSTEARDCKF
jgi:hypothetical protein